MFDYIKGILVHIEHNYIVVEAHGVGYQIVCSDPFRFAKDEGQESTIYTYQYVREDLIALYGFKSRAERSVFQRLILVNGIGPKNALGMLSVCPAGQLVWAIHNEELQTLINLPGIGKKTAQRLIMDLKDKLEDLLPLFSEDMFTKSNPIIQPKSAHLTDDVQLKEVQEAMLALGYTTREYDSIKGKLREKIGQGESMSIDQLIKYSLQLLSRQKV